MRSNIIIIITTLSLLVLALEADEPKQLTGLRDSYTKARFAATAPIDKKYVEALTAMKLQLTKSGDLKGALAVDAEITQIASLSAPAKNPTQSRRLGDFVTVEAFSSWLATTRWTKDTNIYTFENGQMTEKTSQKSVSRPFTVLEVGKVTWEWTPGLTAILVVSPRLDTADHQIDGKTTFVLVRD